MTLNYFINKWNGKYLDFDGVYGPQCTDLMRGYIKEVYTLNPYLAVPTTGWAKNIFNNFKDNQYFKKVLNTPTGVPKVGDILFWGWRFPVTGIKGHVAIFTGGDVNKFIVFGQNYGKPNYCRYQNYDYRGVLGWLAKK